MAGGRKAKRLRLGGSRVAAASGDRQCGGEGGDVVAVVGGGGAPPSTGWCAGPGAIRASSSSILDVAAAATAAATATAGPPASCSRPHGSAPWCTARLNVDRMASDPDDGEAGRSASAPGVIGHRTAPPHSQHCTTHFATRVRSRVLRPCAQTRLAGRRGADGAAEAGRGAGPTPGGRGLPPGGGACDVIGRPRGG